MSKENTKKVNVCVQEQQNMPLLSHSSTAAGITADITRFTLLSLSLLLSFSPFPDSTAKARHNKFPHIYYYRVSST